MAVRSHWAVAGGYRTYNTATVKDGRIVVGDLHPMGEDRRGPITQKAPGAWLWGLNMGFPLEAALQVNGFDEKYSGQMGSEDCDMGVRIERGGCQVVHEPRCLINQIMETHEAVDGHAGWGTPQPVKQKELLLQDGKMHFANERLIEFLIEEPDRKLPLGNDFNLREIRKTVLATGAFPTTRKLTHDWRDDAPLETCE